VHLRQWLQGLIGSIAIAASAGVLGAENALTGEIMLGQSAPLTGALAKTTALFNQGALAWLKQVNDSGGAKGRSFRLKSLDDGGWAEQGEIPAPPGRGDASPGRRRAPGA
jgi:branched-chain amino acid transport system substrate-binding protein